MKTDVLIVGGGLAGLNAAAELRERHPELSYRIADRGGCASTEIMGFCAPVVPGDSPECFYNDILRAGAGLNTPETARILADRALPELYRLERMGIRFDRNPDGSRAVIRSVGSTFPRVVHSGTTTGKLAMRLLTQELLRERIVKLFLRNDRVCGALMENGTVIRCKAVILAGGGFAGLWKFSTWSKRLRGDSLVLAQEAGCELCNLGCVQFEPTVAVFPEPVYGFPVITTILHEGARLYGTDGTDLFTGEVPAKRKLAELIRNAIRNGFGFPHGGVMYDLSGVDESVFRSKYPEYYRKFMTLFPSFKEIRFEVKPAAHTTLGGIRIGPDASSTVSGIFAAGEAVGNLHGADRLGGNAGLEVFVFGRIAGASAGDYAAGCCFEELPELPAGSVPDSEPDARIAEILDRCFTVIPDRERCIEGISELEKMPSGGIARILREAFGDRLLKLSSESRNRTEEV